MRNIGSSIGTSIVTTMLARRAQYHQQILVGHITPDTPVFRNALNALTQAIAHSGFSRHDAHAQAIARLYMQVNRQAHTLAYLDTFWVLAVLSAVMFILAFFLKKNDPGAGGQIAAG
jgi:MFS transporter, DHA2 family, multidrug resistance protein